MKASAFLRFAMAVVLACGWVPARAAESIKVAHIDPLSGPFGLVGESLGKQLQAAIDDVNAKGGVVGGVKLELVNLDNKQSPQESTLLLKQVTEAHIHFITQAAGSNVAHALVDAISKNNGRNPDQTIVYINFGAQDPALTNDRCSFWHFRTDANTDMKLGAITDYIAQQKQIQKVYLFNQDYAFGQAISRAGKEMLARKRPDIKIVGDDLHPLGKVKDFAPYIAKIKASGADTVITGNWGPDLSLLIKASKDAGLAVIYYTLNAHNSGVPTAIGKAGADHIKQIFDWHTNVADNHIEKFAVDYHKRYNEDFYYHSAKTTIDLLAKAINAAGSADPVKVARALEGMKTQGDAGPVWMRAEDHQLIQPLYIATFTHAGGEVKYDAEGTGFGWKTDVRIEGKDTVMPTTCKMERPAN